MCILGKKIWLHPVERKHDQKSFFTPFNDYKKQVQDYCLPKQGQKDIYFLSLEMNFPCLFTFISIPNLFLMRLFTHRIMLPCHVECASRSPVLCYVLMSLATVFKFTRLNIKQNEHRFLLSLTCLNRYVQL